MSSPLLSCCASCSCINRQLCYPCESASEEIGRRELARECMEWWRDWYAVLASGNFAVEAKRFAAKYHMKPPLDHSDPDLFEQWLREKGLIEA